MSKSNKVETEVQSMREFCDFVEAEQVAPSTDLDRVVVGRVVADLAPSPWRVYTKFAVIESFVGVATLLFCPQFGVNLGGNEDYFAGLHQYTGGFLFYLLCGLIFVSLGGVISALLLRQEELRAIATGQYLYYLLFAVVACLIFLMLGADVLLVSALPWIVGGYLGNLFGFGPIAGWRVSRMA